MKPARYLAFSMVVAVLAALLVVPGVLAASTTTDVWQVNVTVPVVNRAALGTLTTNVDPATGQGTWSFQGTVDGQFATAAGRGTVSGSSSSATITMTSIDSWSVPGIAQPPDLPLSATVRSVGGVSYVSFSGNPINFKDVPVAVSPSVSFPLQAGTFTVTMAGSGSQSTGVLPLTGVVGAPVSASSIPWVAFEAVAAALLAAVGGAAVALSLDRRLAAR